MEHLKPVTDQVENQLVFVSSEPYSRAAQAWGMPAKINSVDLLHACLSRSQTEETDFQPVKWQVKKTACLLVEISDGGN